MKLICAVGVLAIVAYVAVSIFLFRKTMDFLGKFADEMNEFNESTGKELDERVVTILSVIVGFMWPITVFGIGCGWGIKKYCDTSKAKMTMMIHNMLDRCDNKDPVGKEEWTIFFTENIGRIPRHQLLKLSIFGFNGSPLSGDELNKIISSEIADRDLFGIRK